MANSAVAQFTEITGASPGTANQFLQLTDYNLQLAMQLYFEHESAESQLPTEAPSAPPASSRPRGPIQTAGYEDEHGVVHIDSDVDTSDDDNPVSSENNPPRLTSSGQTVSAADAGSTYDDDLAMARRLQEELYAGGDTDGVRAPLGRTTETLVGPDMGFDNPEDMNAAVMRQIRARRQARSNRPGIFNQRDVTSSIWNESRSTSQQPSLSQTTGGASDVSSKSNMLAEMYRPPFEIICRLPWDMARAEGREMEKWLLVNIQDPSIFDCQVLNRDIWKNSGIMETVKEHFIFLQYAKDDPRGAQYLQYYFLDSDAQDNYPHIAIVDPRTGEQVKIWSGPPVIAASDFHMQLREFLDRYSLSHNARNPVAKRKPEVKQQRKIETMTEEEMLEMAVKNSLEGHTQLRHEDPDDLTRSIGDIRGKERETRAGDGDVDMESPAYKSHDEDESAQIDSPFFSIPSNQPHVEPAPDPATTTRIQFRHPSGRVIRRFNLSDPIQRIYEWLKASPLEGKDGVEFELVSMGQNLIGLRETTIQDAGLKNGTVMVGFVED